MLEEWPKFGTKFLECLQSFCGYIFVEQITERRMHAKLTDAQAAQNEKAISDGLKYYDHKNKQLLDVPQNSTDTYIINSQLLLDGKRKFENRLQVSVRALDEAEAIVASGKIPEVKKEMPDLDWLVKFYKYAEDISNEKVQELWARVLMREIVSPGYFDLVTLELLSRITEREAMIIEKYASLVFFNKFHINYGSSGDKTGDLNLILPFSNDELSILDALGFIELSTGISKVFSRNVFSKIEVIEIDNGFSQQKFEKSVVLKSLFEEHEETLKNDEIGPMPMFVKPIQQKILELAEVELNSEYLIKLKQDAVRTGAIKLEVCKTDDDGNIIDSHVILEPKEVEAIKGKMKVAELKNVDDAKLDKNNDHN